MLLLAAVAPGTAPASPETLSPQLLFDQASTAAIENDCKTAITLFDALDRRQVLKAGSIPDAIVAVRKGGCLMQTNRLVDGERAIQRGLPILEKAGSEFAGDVAIAT